MRAAGSLRPADGQGGGGGITQVTSGDGSISVTNPMGPIVGISATAASVGADPSGTATAEVAAHVALPDPHTQYVLDSKLPTIVERFPNFQMGVGSGYGQLRSFSIAQGEAISLSGDIKVFRGTDPNVTARSGEFSANARRDTGAATPSASINFSDSNGDGPAFQARWVAGPGADECTLELRDGPDSLATVVLEYTIAREPAPQ